MALPQKYAMRLIHIRLQPGDRNVGKHSETF
jgi:hypothetical protein